MGQCLFYGMSERIFWKSSYRAVYNLIHTAQEKEENKVRQAWEQTRVICGFSGYAKPGPSGKIFDLPWDSDNVAIREETPEEKRNRERVFAKIDKLMQKNGQK